MNPQKLFHYYLKVFNYKPRIVTLKLFHYYLKVFNHKPRIVTLKIFYKFSKIIPLLFGIF